MSDPIMSESTRRGRALQAGMTPLCVAKYFEVRFEVSAICRGCDISTITLFDEPEDENLFERFLHNTPARRLNIEEHNGGAELFGNEFDQEDGDASESRSLSEGSECRCPLDPTFRAVTEYETTMAFNATISRLLPLIVVDLYQVLPVPCNLQVETFGTTVEVDFEFESVDGIISQGDRDALIQRFLLSYNALQGRYCDPYFREVATAQIVDQKVTPTIRNRSLRIRQRAKFKVTIRIAVVGTCRGCGTNGQLFQVRYPLLAHCLVVRVFVTATSFPNVFLLRMMP
jgi:Fe-S cluster biogenesis protein NfuA